MLLGLVRKPDSPSHSSCHPAGPQGAGGAASVAPFRPNGNPSYDHEHSLAETLLCLNCVEWLFFLMWILPETGDFENERRAAVTGQSLELRGPWPSWTLPLSPVSTWFGLCVCLLGFLCGRSHGCSLGHVAHDSFIFSSSTKYWRVGYPAVLRRRVFVSPKEREGMFRREKQHMTQKLITKTTKTSSGLRHLGATFAVAE